MAYSDIDVAIDAQVDAALTPPYSIQHDNDEKFIKPNGETYLRSFIRYAPTGNIAFGAGVRYRLNGTLEFQIIGILGEDKTDVNAAVDAIIAAYTTATGFLTLAVGDAAGSVVRFWQITPIPICRVGGA